jgi:hypothetical protein
MHQEPINKFACGGNYNTSCMQYVNYVRSNTADHDQFLTNHIWNSKKKKKTKLRFIRIPIMKF